MLLEPALPLSPSPVCMRVRGSLCASALLPANSSAQEAAPTIFAALRLQLQTNGGPVFVLSRDHLPTPLDSLDALEHARVTGSGPSVDWIPVTLALSLSPPSSDLHTPIPTPVLTETQCTVASCQIVYSVPVDMLTRLPLSLSGAEAVEKLRLRLTNYLDNMEKQVVRLGSTEAVSIPPPKCTPYHFQVPPRIDPDTHTPEPMAVSRKSEREYPALATVFYPDGVPEEQLVESRLEMHRELDIPTDRPVLRRGNALFQESKLGGVTCQLWLDESWVPLVPSGKANSNSGIPHSQCVVRGKYAYFHYLQDGFDDTGWGCAYRSLQTLWSWFLVHAYTALPVITHRDIQQTLHSIGDKPGVFVGSSQWIGSFEVSYVLQHWLGVQAAFITTQSGAHLARHAPKLAQHFRTQGTPVMIGGGTLAHTICGVALPAEDTDELGDPEKEGSGVYFLVLDPHYTGPEDHASIRRKGALAWKPLSFWNPDAYYNICLPQRPHQC